MTKRRDFLVGAGAGLAALASGCEPTDSRTAEPAAAQPAPSLKLTFFAAVRDGDVERISSLVGHQPGLIRTHDGQGRSPLTVALLSEQGPAADRLRKLGYAPDLAESAWIGDWERFDGLADADPASVHTDHALGPSAMHAAARGGRGSEIWHVYAKGGLPNHSTDDLGFSALHAALQHRDLAVAEVTAATLLSNAANPNVRSADAATPLHAAAGRGSAELVEMLVRKGANAEAKNAEGKTPRDVAAENDHGAVVALLARHVRIARDHVALRHAFDAQGRPYQPARLDNVDRLAQGAFVGKGHFDLDGLRAALDDDPRMIHATATTGEIAVEAASHVGQVGIAEFLLDRGAPLSMPTAVLRGDVGAVGELLDAEPDRIHERGPHDFGLLWYPVIGGGSIPMAKLLIQRGASIEAQSYLGTTALHFAVMGGQKEMVAFLIERGANVNRVSRKFAAAGKTPLAMAIERKQPAVAALLEERGARTG